MQICEHDASEERSREEGGGRKVHEAAKLFPKNAAAQLGTSLMLRERSTEQPPVMEKFIMAESSEEGYNSVFADPLEAKSVPSSKTSSGSDTELEDETHELELAPTSSASRENPLAAEAQESPKQELESLGRPGKRPAKPP